jgi:hypothetical protein
MTEYELITYAAKHDASVLASNLTDEQRVERALLALHTRGMAHATFETMFRFEHWLVIEDPDEGLNVFIFDNVHDADWAFTGFRNACLAGEI